MYYFAQKLYVILLHKCCLMYIEKGRSDYQCCSCLLLDNGGVPCSICVASSISYSILYSLVSLFPDKLSVNLWWCAFLHGCHWKLPIFARRAKQGQ